MAVGADAGAGEVEHHGPRRLARMGRVAEQHAEARHRRGEPRVRGRLPRASATGTTLSGRVSPSGCLKRSLTVSSSWLAVPPPASCHRGWLVLQRVDAGQAMSDAGGHDLVERGHGVAGADLAGVLRVVVEVLGARAAVLVADQAVARRPAPG